MGFLGAPAGGSGLLGAGVLGDGLGALGDGVLGQLPGEEEADGRLDLPGGDGAPLVVLGQAGGLRRDPLEDVVHERVHDGHGLGGDARVGVDLLEDLVDVRGVGLLPLALPLLVPGAGGLLGLGGLLGSLGGGFGRHSETIRRDETQSLRPPPSRNYLSAGVCQTDSKPGQSAPREGGFGVSLTNAQALLPGFARGKGGQKQSSHGPGDLN